MIKWHRDDGVVVGTLEPERVAWLRSRLAEFHALLDWRLSQYTTDYPLGEVLGIALPTEPTDHPPLQAVLRLHVAESEPTEVRLWWEPELIGGLRSAVADAWRNLPTEGGVVRLPDDPHRLRAWTRVLLSLRIAYLATWVPEALSAPLPEDAPADQRRRYDRACWLRAVVDTLGEFTGLGASRG
ncbi:hypothetical protein GCM10010174_08040 [Kutzneria viridogrisea]|uniref:Uncharacterized protein n=2 Tax=Kutzneria TaxID=43356 RepID=W5WK63_9PSEU|nr:DUF2017 family protein [Kutzneria albida]AHI01594.1 hypothetical protein KALB_8236 [Kutzneria albida DSM 43870]MBA8931558.1 hypothetical protein [Kutzneria viridogrisea]